MSNDVEDLVREGLDRLTGGARVPQGLVRKAVADRRRRMATRAGIASVTAAAVAVTVVAGIGGGGAPALTAQTTAYVVSHVSRALSPAELSKQIEEVTVPHQVVTTTLGGQPSHRYTVDESAGWSYGGKVREDLYGGSRIAAELWLPSGLYVIPGSKTWTQARLYHFADVLPAVKDGCQRPRTPVTQLYFASPSFIRATLACGGFAVAGHARIGGQPVIKLTSTPRWAIPMPASLYVSPETYLPVRIITWGATVNYTWRPATPRNVRLLTPKVPSGFRRVAPWPAQSLDPVITSRPDLRLMPILIHPVVP